MTCCPISINKFNIHVEYISSNLTTYRIQYVVSYLLQVPIPYPTAIFIRERALVVNFENIRLIIAKDQVGQHSSWYISSSFRVKLQVLYETRRTDCTTTCTATATEVLCFIAYMFAVLDANIYFFTVCIGFWLFLHGLVVILTISSILLKCVKHIIRVCVNKY